MMCLSVWEVALIIFLAPQRPITDRVPERVVLRMRFPARRRRFAVAFLLLPSRFFFCCCPALLSSLLLLFITHQSFLSVRACVRAPWRRTFALPLRRVYLNGAGTPLLPCEVRQGETVFRDGEKGCKRERRCKSGPGQPRWNAGIVSSSPLSFRQIRRCRSASPFAGRSL